MSKIIAFANHKGGTGKTTSAVNVAAYLQLAGKQVLIIDLDPQANISLCLGIEETAGGIYEALKSGVLTTPQPYRSGGGIDIIPSSLDLAAAEMELTAEAGREYILKELLSTARGYDYILLDCPPSLGLLTLNGLTAADIVIIPVQAEFLAVRGVSKITEIVNKVKRRLNTGLKLAVIVTRYSPNKVLNRNVMEAVQTTYKENYLGYIRENIALAEASATGKTIYDYSPKSAGASDYSQITNKIMEL